MSEMNVRPVLFKHAFWGHVITETVAGICTLIIALLVQQFVGHRVLGWETVVILALSVVVFSLLSTAYLQWDRHRRPDDRSGDLLIGIIDFVLRLLVTSGIASLLVSNTTLLSIIIGAAITSVLLFVFEKPWQSGMTITLNANGYKCEFYMEDSDLCEAFRLSSQLSGNPISAILRRLRFSKSVWIKSVSFDGHVVPGDIVRSMNAIISRAP